MRLGSLVVVVLAVAACSPGMGGNTGGGSGSTGGGSGTGGGATGTGGGTVNAGQLPCDVAAVMSGSCTECHSNPPVFGAPMPLVTWADTQADSPLFPGQKIHQRMAARVTAAERPMPQAPRTLTPTQKAAIVDWSAAGAMQGTAMCGTGGGSGAGGGMAGPGCAAGETKIDVAAPMFDIPQKSDFYQCFATTVSLPAKRHAVKIDKLIDDARVLHHVVLFRDLGKNAPAADGDCGVEADWQALYAWGPGAGPLVPPPDVGIPVNNGDQLVIQIHYNNPTNVVGKDSSGAYLCVTDQLKAKEAGVLAIGPTKLKLPPNCAATSAAGTCTNVLSTTFNVFTTWPHMHVKGRAMKTTLQHSGAADVVVTDRPNYDFGSQYLETVDFQFRPGDVLTNKCTWNTIGAAGTTPWGEETTNEMCFNFLYLYPVPPIPFCPSPNPPDSTCP